MKFKWTALFALGFALFAAVPTMAQTGIYSEFNATDIQSAGEPWMYGVTFGTYFDKHFSQHIPNMTLGPDFRLALQSGSNSAYSGGPAQSLISILLGPRLAFKLPVVPIHPYIEGLIGGSDSQIGELIPDGYQTSANTPRGTAINKNGGGTMEGHVLGGLDMKISKHLDWRMVEFNYGKLFLSAGGTPDYGLTTLSTGFVVRLP